VGAKKKFLVAIKRIQNTESEGVQLSVSDNYSSTKSFFGQKKNVQRSLKIFLCGTVNVGTSNIPF